MKSPAKRRALGAESCPETLEKLSMLTPFEYYKGFLKATAYYLLFRPLRQGTLLTLIVIRLAQTGHLWLCGFFGLIPFELEQKKYGGARALNSALRSDHRPAAHCAKSQ